MPIDLDQQMQIQIEIIATINAYLAVRKGQTGTITVGDLNAILAALMTVEDTFITQVVRAIRAQRQADALSVIPV
jgi:hypothetical protein